ncbi:MAG: NAD(P)/FAD-dependent oxidoreductase, partial [Shimia sp.]
MWDVAIIGGGVAGLSLGAALAPDAKVVVLEAETALGYHASGRSAALYEPNYGNGPVRALSEASSDGFAAAGVLSPRGVLLIARAGEAEAFAADRDTLALDDITPDEARDLCPILNPAVVTQAAATDRPQDIDTDLLLQGFRRTILAAGGEVRTGTRITALHRDADAWRLDTAEPLQAAHIVNAAGAWADDVARSAGASPLGLRPLRRSMARLAAP